MTNIVFKRMEIHNFMSYGDEKFDFEKTQGMSLITGKNLDIIGSKNGVGKSSLAYALHYGLFGCLPFKLNNRNIPNRFIKGDNLTSVTIFLRSGKDNYKICSGLNGRASYCQLFRLSNGKEFDITKSTIAETRSYIQKEIIMCDSQLFMRTTFLNSDPDYNFYNLSGREKDDFLDKIFNLKVYRDMYSFNHRRLLELEKTLIGHQNQMMVLQKNDEEYHSRNAEFIEINENEKIRLSKELAEAENELEKKKSVIVERNTEMVSKCQTAMEKVLNIISDSKLKVQKSEFAIRSLKGNISILEGKIKDREAIINRHSELKNKLCEDCRSVFSNHYNLESYQEEIRKYRDEIADNKVNLVKENESYKGFCERQTTAESKRDLINSKILELNGEYERLRKDILSSETSVSTLRTKIENISNMSNPYTQMIENNNAKMSLETESIETLVEEINHRKTIEEIVGQDNIKKYVIKGTVGVFNDKVKHFLHLLGANYDVIFDENMDYKFVTQDMDSAEFHNFSSGEQMRISIATCLAFRDFLSSKNSMTSNILILDEFIDSNVDSQCIDNTVEILKDFSSVNGQNIYLVSHRQEVGIDNFDRIIQIEKKDNVSSIKYFKP